MALLILIQWELFRKVWDVSMSQRRSAGTGDSLAHRAGTEDAFPWSPLCQNIWKQGWIFLQQRRINFPSIVTFIKGDTRFPCHFPTLNAQLQKTVSLLRLLMKQYNHQDYRDPSLKVVQMDQFQHEERELPHLKIWAKGQMLLECIFLFPLWNTVVEEATVNSCPWEDVSRELCVLNVQFLLLFWNSFETHFSPYLGPCLEVEYRGEVERDVPCC